MKHHIALKFIAILLATLSLFTLIASAVGVIGFTAADLYERSVDELYEENMVSTRQNLAVHLLHQYASMELGGIPEQYFYERWGSSWLYDNFQYGYYFYTIRNDKGTVVESTAEGMPEGTTAYTHVVTELSYRHLIQIFNEEGTVAEATLPPSHDTAATGVTVPTTASNARPEDEVHHDGYYDHEQQWVEFTFYYDNLAPYTVELYLLPGAVVVEPAWELLSAAWQLRYALFYVLGISILVFAVASVYLCCAAGRKPGQEEIRPAALNCIPLDLYALTCGSLIVGIGFMGIHGGEALLRNSPDVLVPFAIFAGCGACLIFVVFCFACAAQFKTPGGYWWRHSLVGQCFRAVWLLGELFTSLCKQAFPFLFEKAGQLVLLVWELGKKLFRFAESLLMKFFALVGRILRWIGTQVSRMISLLPLTWQWLLGGAVLLFLCFLYWPNRNDGWGFVWLLLGLGLILFVSNCFGILHEATKRMSRGDLDTKVEDKRLIGCFQEFAGDLNALADVAVIAAQKQLKSERMKTELITNVSHDIKTPLTSIINYVDLLKKPHTPEEGEQYLEVLDRQSQRLKKLVDDLMEMSKASSGNLAVEIVSVNAGEAVNQALGEFADKLEKAQLIPVFRQPEEPVFMKADGRLVWRVMSNLLSNAVKYALPGTRLYVDLERQDGKVLISMKNISREELNVHADELMERFVRGDTSRNTEGSGLGLNIAQSLMQVQKGQLQLLVDGDLFKVTLTFPEVKM